MSKQQTLKQSATISGIALHTGARANLTIRPAEENHGIVFRRSDIDNPDDIKALATNVVDVRRGTTISSGKSTVHTVEHILSAMNAMQIDNALVEMDGPEPPICDGSAFPFLKLIKDAGIQKQEAEAEYWLTDSTIIVEEGDTKLILTPSDSLKITCIVAYGATPIDSQYFSEEISSELYENEVAAARTFCIYRELQELISMGLIKGGSLDNAVVMHDGAVISKNGMRFKDEFVKHKIIDILGDIYLTGKRVKAHIIAVKPGHPTNVKLANKMLEMKG